MSNDNWVKRVITMKFRKKPVVIEACQCNRNGFSGIIPEWIRDAFANHILKNDDGRLSIETLEGPMYASPGDYIIQGVNGELYACKLDVFEKTDEPVEDNR